MLVLLLLVALVLPPPALLFPKENFFEFGLSVDEVLPQEEDEVSSPEIFLKVPIVFYGEVYHSIFVNANGLLSFLTDIPSFFNIQFPLDYPVIAPLYTNVDTRASGAVYYRETGNADLLNEATQHIQSVFRSSGTQFRATSLFIATWDSVGYFSMGADKVNTYQVIVASNGTDSYVELLYADGGIQWIQGSGQDSGLPDARAQAGLVSGDGRLYTLLGSGTDQIQFIDKWTNVGEPGKWLFHIGQTGESGNVVPPDLNVQDVELTVNTCSSLGYVVCHSKATCEDHNHGFCCSCRPGYYGNGINCLRDGIPLRVNGKISGTINDIDLDNLDVQSYVVTPDGRTYTAVSRVPEVLGYDMQSLNVLGGVIGWLFARPINHAVNGYQLTGGVFNHTAEITFPQSGHKVTLKQKYTGLDVFDQLKLESEIHGNIPSIPLGTAIEISEYEEQYTRTGPGTIQSQSSQSFSLKGVPVENPFTVQHTIQYKECSYNPPNITTLRLKVARNLINYEAREKIIRYGMTSKVSPLGDVNPCQEGRLSCVEHSSCIVEGDTFRCVCNPGYQFLYIDYAPQDSPTCMDINECSTGSHDCDLNAICVNELGSYNCHCSVGYSGDGKTCTKLLSCENLQCHPDADCVETHSGLLQCQCLPGFTGNGILCSPLQESCKVANNCSPLATCYHDNRHATSTCVCLPGYKGDGYSCVSTGQLYSNDAVAIPKCSNGVCWCPHPLVLQDDMCMRNTLNNESEDGAGDTQLSCNIDNNCDPNAQCIFTVLLKYECQCNAGYEGDGHDCREIDVSCSEADICDNNANCSYDEELGKDICKCNAGYQGDGFFCTYSDECHSDVECDSNAHCSWSHQFGHYQCLCREGYTRHGETCEPSQDSGCLALDDCHYNAQCLFNSYLGGYTCECNPGYSGDGKICSADPIGCNVLNNCGVGADCVYDQKAGGNQCKCRQGFIGDGLVCVPESSCQQNPHLCGHDASCVLGVDGYHVCQCNQGFTGNGAICRPVSRHEGNFLLLNQGMAMLKVPFIQSGRQKGRPIAIQPFQVALGIDVDCEEGRVYWSDITGHNIKSSRYNGSNITNFLISDIGSPEGVSIDWVSRNIYWTDSSKDTIEVANLDSRLRKVLIADGLVNPRGIAVHPSRGKLFWSDWNRQGPKLEWANLDGTGRSEFLTGPSVVLPNSLAIDWDQDELCWADAGTKAIDCMGIGNSVRRTVVSNCSYPFGLTITQENYYWTDWHTKMIESAQRPYGQRNKGISAPLGGSGKLYGIVAVPEECHRMSNACQFENGQCGEGRLCLPNGAGSRSCVCADADDEGSGEAAICNDII